MNIEKSTKNHLIQKIPVFENRCFVCLKWFAGKNVRDQHLVIHFNSILNTVMDKIDEIYCNMSGNIFVNLNLDRFLCVFQFYIEMYTCINDLEKYVPNQCPLCNFVMSTRKSLRHHLLLRHVLRDQNSYRLLLAEKKVKESERTLAELVLQTPELLWKRAIPQPLKFPVHLSLALSKPKLSGIKESTTKLLSTKSAYTQDDQSVEINRTHHEPSWMKLRNYLIKKCLKPAASEPKNPNEDKLLLNSQLWGCSLCDSLTFCQQIDFELHIAVHHLTIALDFYSQLHT